MIIKVYKVKSGYKMAHGVKSAGNQAQASKSPFSVESQDMLNSSSHQFDDLCEVLSTREAGCRLNAQGF